jgi:hypothetical protein
MSSISYRTREAVTNAEDAARLERVLALIPAGPPYLAPIEAATFSLFIIVGYCVGQRLWPLAVVLGIVTAGISALGLYRLKRRKSYGQFALFLTIALLMFGWSLLPIWFAHPRWSPAHSLWSFPHGEHPFILH